ncbi:MAG: hypothetical protein GY708_18080 [Actinomycetia bacterium]|nr:hypothetical protein [Actinomycetes bacterium]
MFRIPYRFFALLTRLAVRSGRSKDLEIIVPRHQLTVLRRQLDKPTINDDDRALLGAITAALPRRLRLEPAIALAVVVFGGSMIRRDREQRPTGATNRWPSPKRREA